MTLCLQHIRMLLKLLILCLEHIQVLPELLLMFFVLLYDTLDLVLYTRVLFNHFIVLALEIFC
jgi:hypothetical protein